MARKPSNSGLITRRAALAGAAAAAGYGVARGNAATAGPASDPAAAKNGAGPVFSATGPAVLRDYARIGRLLAHDGAWQGKQIIPVQWMIEATTVRPSDAYLLPGKTNTGYGYLLWLLPGDRRQFAMIGNFGQYIFVDPAFRLVMVQTALENHDEVWRLWAALV